MLRRSVNPWAVIWTTALAQLLRLACLAVLRRSYRIRLERSTPKGSIRFDATNIQREERMVWVSLHFFIFATDVTTSTHTC